MKSMLYWPHNKSLAGAAEAQGSADITAEKDLHQVMSMHEASSPHGQGWPRGPALPYRGAVRKTPFFIVFYPLHRRFGPLFIPTAMLTVMDRSSSRTVREAVFEALLALPGSEETRSHGSPTFKAGGKTFAYWTVNHHGDGRLALWLAAGPEAQAQLVAHNPSAYFVPPYVGVKGWFGLNLDQGLAWREVQDRILDAWRHVAPSRLEKQAPERLDVPPPTAPIRPEDINPMLGAHPQAVLAGLAERCRQLPETHPEDAAASATWRAGKRPFVRGRIDEDRLKLLFLVGPEQQTFMLDDPRCALPPYYGPSGWIEVDVQDGPNWSEIEGLLETAYRKVALKRMLNALESAPPW